MLGNRIALVGAESPLLDSIAEFLRQQMGFPVLCRSFEHVEKLLARDTDGVFVLTAATKAEVRAISGLVKTIRVMKLP